MLAHQRVTLLSTVATVGLTALLAVAVPRGFFPQHDTGLLVGVAEAAPEASFERMSERRRAAAVVRADPDVASVVSFIGADGNNPTPSTGRLSIALKPRRERGSSRASCASRA